LGPRDEGGAIECLGGAVQSSCCKIAYSDSVGDVKCTEACEPVHAKERAIPL